MAARLFSKTGAFAGTEHIITADTLIGRNQQCDLVLMAQAISGQHARISYDKNTDTYYLEDLGSRNGTQLDRTEVTGRVRLDHLNVITLANEFDLIFQVAEGIPASRSSAARGPASDTRTVVNRDTATPPAVISNEPADDKTVMGQPFSMPSSFESKEKEPANDKTVMGQPFSMPSSFESKEKEPADDKTVMGQPFSMPSFESKEKEPADDKTVMGQPFTMPSSFESKEKEPADDKTVMGQPFTMPPSFKQHESKGAPDRQEKKTPPDPSEKKTAPDHTVMATPSENLPNIGPPPTAREPRETQEASKVITLEIKHSSGEVAAYSLKKGRNVIGRSMSSDVIIDNPFMSGRHAEIQVMDDRVLLIDLDSSNHTFVDNKKITEPVVLKSGMIIRFGPNVKARIR